MKHKSLSSTYKRAYGWYWQRISAVALLLLIPALMLLLLLTYSGNISFDALNIWLTHSINKTMSLLFLFAILIHMQIGLKVIIKDYVHSPAIRIAALNILLLLIIGFAAYMSYHIWGELSYA